MMQYNILPFIPKSSYWAFSFMLSNQNVLYAYFIICGNPALHRKPAVYGLAILKPTLYCIAFVKMSNRTSKPNPYSTEYIMDLFISTRSI
jgi:hypothetical protein